jgi:tetratricopeptide (TPR) repeat protein
MDYYKKILLPILCFCSLQLFSQTTKEIAIKKGADAVKLIEKKQYEAAIKLLQEARKADPTNYKYLYQMGLAYHFKKDVKNAILVFSQVIKMPTATPECYVTYGNILDDNGQQENALKIYNDGLSRFPKSGKLYLEKANIFTAQKKYNQAISYYEKGIEAEPMFAPNYYHAAKLYCYSNEEVWGMIYGEIYMNLERNSKRTAETSKLLYDTYKSEIKFISDSTISVSFSKSGNSTNKNIEPFGVAVYEPTLIASMTGIKNVNINTLDKVRNRFLDLYYWKNFNETYPNVLFEFQKAIKDAGYFDAYNHWLLYKGDETGFTEWQLKNKDTWEKFTTWYKENKINIDSTNVFVRTKY